MVRRVLELVYGELEPDIAVDKRQEEWPLSVLLLMMWLLLESDS